MTMTMQQLHFRQTIEALALAAPVCLASQFENGLAHCVEASICGAIALTSRKLEARAIPCAMIGVNESQGIDMAVGLTAKEVYERMSPDDGPLPSFEEWCADKRFPGGDCPIHMVIEARYHNERAIIDLTAGQLRQSHGIELPLSLHFFGEGWKEFERKGWRLMYIDSPHAEEILKKTSGVKNLGLVGDLEDLMAVAIQVGLDRDRFWQALRRAHPQQFDIALARLNRFAALGQSAMQ